MSQYKSLESVLKMELNFFHIAYFSKSARWMILFLLVVCYYTLIILKTAEKPTVIWFFIQNYFKSTVLRWYFGLESGIWALGLGLGPWGDDLALEARIWVGEGGRTEEKFPHVWKHRSSTPLGPLPCFPFNFKHNLLGQGMPTADHLTLLRLFLVLRDLDLGLRDPDSGL